MEREITEGWVVGLRRKERKSSGGEVAIVFRMGRRYGWEAENFVQREAAATVAVLSPGHLLVARWRRVPGVGGSQPGSWQMPAGSLLQYLLSQQVW